MNTILLASVLHPPPAGRVPAHDRHMLAGSRSVCNLFILKKLKQFADSPTSLRPQHATTITIQKWLKSRGVLGIDIEEPDATNNEDDIFGPTTSTATNTTGGDGGGIGDKRSSSKKKSLKKGKSGGGSGVYDEEGAIPPPWTAAKHKAPSDPHLTPITSLDFPRYYLHLAIPGGHMAMCRASLEEDMVEFGDRPQTKHTFPGLKHCKEFRLDGKTIREKHCVFFRLGTSVKIRPLYDEDGNAALVEVNGRAIFEETVLHDNDTLRLGVHCMFILSIPNEPPPVNLGPKPTGGIGVPSALRNNNNNEPNGDNSGNDGTDNGDNLGNSIQVEDTLTALQNLSTVVCASDADLNSMRWEHCCCAVMQNDFLKAIVHTQSQLRHAAHMEVDREYVEIAKKSELSDIAKLPAYDPSMAELADICISMVSSHKAAICELLVGIEDVNYWSRALRRYVRYMVHLEPAPEEDVETGDDGVLSGGAASNGAAPSAASSGTGYTPRQYRGMEHGVYINGKKFYVKVRAEVLDDDNECSARGDSWVWSYTVFIRRYFMMRLMYTSFMTVCEEDLEILDEVYPTAIDPFFDPSQPELIGAATLHLDSLFYLCDVKDMLPIVTFKGNRGGLLKMTARTWIDVVETIPSYICVDKESKLTDFPGKKCIIRFYFESLNDINPTLSSDVQIVFTFFCHSGQYRTSRHPARNTEDGDKHPFVNSTIVVEQKITPDFIRYVQKKCVEIEVWGCRLSNAQFSKDDSSFEANFSSQSAAARVGDAGMAEKLGVCVAAVLAKRRADEVREFGGKESGGAGPQTEAAEEDDVFGDDEDGGTVATSKVGGEDVESLKLKLKEMAILLDKAEKNLKRTTRTSAVFRDEISKTNAKIAQSSQLSEARLREKELEMEDMKAKIAQLEALREQQQTELRQLKQQQQKQSSRACVVS